MALMAQYLPLAHTALERTRTAARARGLRASGLAYWRIALPQIFRLLVEYPNKQALALTTRGLDAPEAWVLRQPFLGAEVAAAAAIVACAAVLAFFV